MAKTKRKAFGYIRVSTVMQIEGEKKSRPISKLWKELDL